MNIKLLYNLIKLLKDEEAEYLINNPERCIRCGHLIILHNDEMGFCHCCQCALFTTQEEDRQKDYARRGKNEFGV